MCFVVQDVRRKEASEAASQMAVHREQVRGARAHINKDDLRALGAQFRARALTPPTGEAAHQVGSIIHGI